MKQIKSINNNQYVSVMRDSERRTIPQDDLLIGDLAYLEMG